MSPGAIPFARREARSGFDWIKRAFAMFRAAPQRWLLLLFTYYALMGLLEVGPIQVVGQFVAPLLKPVFAVGFLAAAWSQERGVAPRFADLFRGFRSNLLALLPLGAVFLAGISVAILSTTLVDDGKLIAIVSGIERPTEETLANDRVLLALILGLACAMPSLLALWFAPALVVFNDAGAVKALVTSLRASIVNWRAMAVYYLALFALGGIVPVLVLSIARLFGDVAAGVVFLFVVIPYLFAFVATLQISDYVDYRDLFHGDQPMSTSPPLTRPDAKP